jgi:HTH-type transcriptional regulator/antitoxin HigA
MSTKAQSDYFELVNRVPLVTIKSEIQYKKALKTFKQLALKDASLTKGELQYFEVLSMLLKRYEEEHFYASHPSPQEILRSFMQDHSLSQAAVARVAGDHESNISAFLANKRNLSKRSTARLAKHFAVNPALFSSSPFEQTG